MSVTREEVEAAILKDVCIQSHIRGYTVGDWLAKLEEEETQRKKKGSK